MDPRATIREWCEISPMPEARSATRGMNRDYNEWMSKGGFPARIRIAPHTDLFMMGERFATVIRLGDKFATVKGERSGRTFRIPADSIAEVL